VAHRALADPLRDSSEADDGDVPEVNQQSDCRRSYGDLHQKPLLTAGSGCQAGNTVARLTLSVAR